MRLESKALAMNRRKIDGTHIWEKSEEDTYGSMDHHNVYAVVIFDTERV